MLRALLGLAAAMTAVALPMTVSAQPLTAFSPSERPGGFVGVPSVGDLCRGSVRRDARRDRCRSEVVMDWYGGDWALYNNRSFAPDSYNDWWHDRPDRAYPAWMRHNQDCQRQWFAGDSLTC